MPSEPRLVKFVIDVARINKGYAIAPSIPQTATKHLYVFSWSERSLLFMIEVTGWWHIKEHMQTTRAPAIRRQRRSLALLPLQDGEDVGVPERLNLEHLVLPVACRRHQLSQRTLTN
jgi:hypothetical protein